MAMETLSYLVQYMSENGRCCETILDFRRPATSTRCGRRSCDRPGVGEVKGGQDGTYHAYTNVELQYLSWLLWRRVMLCVAVHLFAVYCKTFKTLSIVRPCAAVLRMEKTCCAWERSRIVVRWR